MLKQGLALISHSALTNHRIVANESEPYPEEAFHQTPPDLPDLIHVNAVPGEKKALSPLVLLQAYGELTGSHPQYRERYLGLLDRLARTDPDNPLVLSGLAWRSTGKGTSEGREEATRYLSRVVELGRASAADYESLADLLGRSGRTREATATLESAIQIYRYNSRLYKSLALLHISARQYSDALEVMKKELDLFPQDDFMRALLKKAVSAQAAPP
jgi:tetratricopeptide (TPR) repeat protein